MMGLQDFCAGTLVQLAASSTIFLASIKPNPKNRETLYPAPFVVHISDLSKAFDLADSTVICCMSLHDRLGFACSTNAIIPEAIEVLAEVPPKSSHPDSVPVVLILVPGRLEALYVVAKIAEHLSLYPCFWLKELRLDTVMV